MGVAVLACWLAQFLGGAYVYVVSGWSAPRKRAFGKWHNFLGKVTFVAGLATCALGLQVRAASMVYVVWISSSV